MMSDHDDVGHQLPYAIEYLEESIFPGPISGAYLPYRWRPTGPYYHPFSANSDERYVLHTSCRGRYTPEVKRTHESMSKTNSASPYGDGSWQPIYWEATLLDVIPLPGCSFAMGLSDMPLNCSFNAPDLAEYSYDGTIRVAGRSNQAAERYGCRDIVGCGFSPNPHKVFFTRNGRLVHEALLRAESCLRPRPIILVFESRPLHAKTRESRRSVYANFGQTPFRFDINSHFRSRFEKARLAASNLPGEIIALIVKALLQSTLNDHPGCVEMQHVSLVCKYWRTLCSQHQYTQLTLHTFNDIESIRRAGARLNFGTLVVRENHRLPWTHRFFVSRLPPQLSSGASLTWSCRYCGDIYAKLPPRVALTVPTIVRNTFTNVRVLALQDCSFPRWIDLAKFVFAFPALERLDIDNKEPPDWKNEGPLSEAPPRWLHFAQRLEHLRISPHGPYAALWARLFLAGRQHHSAQPSPATSAIRPRNLTLSPEDVVAVSNIYHTFGQIHWQGVPQKCLTIHYMVLSDTHCCLSNSCDTDVTLSLEFNKHDSFYRLKALKIMYTGFRSHSWGSPFMRNHNIESLASDLGGLLAASSEGCSCEVHVNSTYPRVRREETMLELYPIYSAMGSVRFLYNGEYVDDVGPKSVAWMSTQSPSFSLNCDSDIWVKEKTHVVSWDVSEVRPGAQSIPWIKLFCVSATEEIYIGDVAKNIDPYAGKAEFTLHKYILGPSELCFLVGE